MSQPATQAWVIETLTRALEAMRDAPVPFADYQAIFPQRVAAALATLPAAQPAQQDDGWPQEPEAWWCPDRSHDERSVQHRDYNAMRDHARAVRAYAEQRIAEAEQRGAAAARGVPEACVWEHPNGTIELRWADDDGGDLEDRGFTLARDLYPWRKGDCAQPVDAAAVRDAALAEEADGYV